MTGCIHTGRPSTKCAPVGMILHWKRRRPRKQVYSRRRLRITVATNSGSVRSLLRCCRPRPLMIVGSYFFMRKDFLYTLPASTLFSLCLSFSHTHTHSLFFLVLFRENKGCPLLYFLLFPRFSCDPCKPISLFLSL